MFKQFYTVLNMLFLVWFTGMFTVLFTVASGSKMITNQPSAADYISVAMQSLTQTFNIVYGIDSQLTYADAEPVDVWEYHPGDLSTSVILVHQGIESLLKAAICSVSPLLLIDIKRAEWPTLPNSEDKDYNELFTLGGEDLIRTYCSVIIHTEQTNEVVRIVNDIRLTRNKIVHGLSREYLEPEYLVEIIIDSHTYFLGKDSWWSTIRETPINNPIFGSFDSAYEEANLVEKLNYVSELLEPAVFRKHLGIDLKCRSYICPWCDLALKVEGTESKSKWAYLFPQKKAKVTVLHCVNCRHNSDVIRRDCDHDGCKGNVLWDDEYYGDIICAYSPQS